MSASAAFGSANAQMANAEQKLDESQKELTDGYKQYEENRESVLENANAEQIVSLDTLQGIISAQNFSMPAGYISDDDMKYLLKIDEESRSVSDVRNMVLMHLDGVGDIRLSDVATVKIVNNSDETYAKVNGSDAAVLAIYKTSSAGTSAVSKALKSAESRLEESHPGLHFNRMMDQGDYIQIIINLCKLAHLKKT